MCRHCSNNSSMPALWHHGSAWVRCYPSVFPCIWCKLCWTGMSRLLLPEVFVVEQRDLNAFARDAPSQRGTTSLPPFESALCNWASDHQTTLKRLGGQWRPFQGHAVPTDLLPGGVCHTETISERSQRSPSRRFWVGINPPGLLESLCIKLSLRSKVQKKKNLKQHLRCKCPVKLLLRGWLLPEASTYHARTKSRPHMLQTHRCFEIERRHFVSRAAACEDDFCVSSSSFFFFFWQRRVKVNREKREK